MNKINFGLTSLVVGIVQGFATYYLLQSAFGDTAPMLLVLAFLITGVILAIFSFKKERQNKISFIMAIVGLVLSLSPIIVIFLAMDFFHGSTVPGI